MNDILPAPVAWLRVAPVGANPDEIDLPDGCTVHGYQNDHDGFITVLIRHKDLPVVPKGGVIPLVAARWTHPEPQFIWQPVGTFEE